MPFQSPKQRRYMHANLPDIANRWEAKYGLGGIAELNSQLNSLPEYYLPKNQGGRIGYGSGSGETYEDFQQFMKDREERDRGKSKQDILRDWEKWKRWKKHGPGTIQEAAHGGFIPSHEAGIYGLAEGGNIRLQPHTASDLLVQKTLSGERPKYQPPGHTDAPSRSSDSGGHSQHATTNVTSRRAPTRAPDFVTGGGGKKTTTRTTTGGDKGWDDSSDDDKAESYVNWNVKEEYGDADLEEQLVIDKRNALTRLKHDPNLTKNERQSLEVGLGLRDPKPKRSIWKTIGMGAAIITGVAPLLGFQAPAAVQTVAQLNALHNKANSALATYNMFNKTNHTLESLFSQVKNMETADKKIINALPEGHPERIQKEGLKKTSFDDGQGGDKVNITMDVEEVNDANADKVALEQKYKEMDEASYAAWLRQQELEAKKQAYLRNFRKTYMVAGGRVPAGYNTGGLSNLFRLKNV